MVHPSTGGSPPPAEGGKGFGECECIRLINGYEKGSALPQSPSAWAIIQRLRLVEHSNGSLALHWLLSGTA